MADDRYNLKNPAVKRILQEVKEMQSNPSDDFTSLPLEENIFEWHFAIRGPADSEFEGGVYHGRIQLPADYPFKPPSFMLLTPNGRFETQTKICLSISNHHPEHWQPSWSVRTALVALIAFMPTPPQGALGSLEYTKEERRALAIKSREAAPKFGSPERQKLIDEIHEYMLSKAPPLPRVSAPQAPIEQPASTESEGQAVPRQDEPVNNPNDETMGNPNDETVNNPNAETVEEQPQFPENVNPSSEDVQPLRQVSARGSGNPSIQQPQVRVQRQGDDRLLTLAAVGLALAIMVLLLKKFIKSSGHGAVFMDES